MDFGEELDFDYGAEFTFNIDDSESDATDNFFWGPGNVSFPPLSFVALIVIPILIIVDTNATLLFICKDFMLVLNLFNSISSGSEQ